MPIDYSIPPLRVPAKAGAFIHDPLQIVTVYHYCKEDYSYPLPPLQDNMVLRRMPYSLRPEHVQSVIDSITPAIRYDDSLMTNRLRYPLHRTLMGIMGIPGNPMWLRDHLRAVLSPRRKELMHWYIAERIAGRAPKFVLNYWMDVARSTPDVIHDQLFRLVEKYVHDCIAEVRPGLIPYASIRNRMPLLYNVFPDDIRTRKAVELETYIMRDVMGHPTHEPMEFYRMLVDGYVPEAEQDAYFNKIRSYTHRKREVITLEYNENKKALAHNIRQE